MSDYRPDNFYSDDYEKLTYLYAEKPNIKPLRPGVFIPSSIRIENKYSRLDKYMSRLVLGEDFKEFFRYFVFFRYFDSKWTVGRNQSKRSYESERFVQKKTVLSQIGAYPSAD